MVWTFSSKSSSTSDPTEAKFLVKVLNQQKISPTWNMANTEFMDRLLQLSFRFSYPSRFLDILDLRFSISFNSVLIIYQNMPYSGSFLLLLGKK